MHQIIPVLQIHDPAGLRGEGRGIADAAQPAPLACNVVRHGVGAAARIPARRLRGKEEIIAVPFDHVREFAVLIFVQRLDDLRHIAVIRGHPENIDGRVGALSLFVCRRDQIAGVCGVIVKEDRHIAHLNAERIVDMMHGECAAGGAGDDKRFAVCIARGLLPVRPDNDLVCMRKIFDVYRFDLAACKGAVLRGIRRIARIAEAPAVGGCGLLKINIAVSVRAKRIAVIGIADLVAAGLVLQAAPLLVVIAVKARGDRAGRKRLHRRILRAALACHGELIEILRARLHVVIRP